MTSSVDTSAASPMAIDSLTIVITAPRVIDGLVFASNTASMSPEDYCTFLLTQDGHRFADANSYGVITSAAFVARFTPQEYGNILAASVPPPDATEDEITQSAQVRALLDELFASPLVALDDPRAIAGLELLVNLGLLDASRPGEILFYSRPTAEVVA